MSYLRNLASFRLVWTWHVRIILCQCKDIVSRFCKKVVYCSNSLQAKTLYLGASLFCVYIQVLFSEIRFSIYTSHFISTLFEDVWHCCTDTTILESKNSLPTNALIRIKYRFRLGIQNEKNQQPSLSDDLSASSSTHGYT